METATTVRDARASDEYGELLVGMESADQQRELSSSGGPGVPLSSTRAGYLPVPLAHVPADAFRDLPIFLRASPENCPASAEGIFALYREADTSFTPADREELLRNGIELAYIRVADQHRFREQADAGIVQIASDPKLAISTRAAMVYETAIELVDELLSDPDWASFSARIEGISRATTTLVLNDPSAFSHLFTASHHDFYTTTHMVNVATCAVPLAYALGYRGIEDLSRICQACLLHDIGKLYVPEAVLNKKDPLTDEDWWLLRRHPEMGCAHLEKYAGVHPLVVTVVREHHERLDGSGYPAGLVGDQLEPVSKICAVVDSFDAMTALRPFKKRTFSVAEAVEILKAETPQKYDRDALEAWIGLLGSVEDSPVPAEPPSAPPLKKEERAYPRYGLNCPARIHVLESASNGGREQRALQVMAHQISRNGMGALSQVPLPAGQTIRVYLLARSWSDEFFEAQTVRCRAYKDGWYEIGIRFTGRGVIGSPAEGADVGASTA